MREAKPHTGMAGASALDCARLAAALTSRELAPGGLSHAGQAFVYVKPDLNGLKSLSPTGRQAGRAKAAASRAQSKAQDAPLFHS